MTRQFSPPLRNVAAITVEGNTATLHRMGDHRITVDLPNDPDRPTVSFTSPFTLTVSSVHVEAENLVLTMPNGGTAKFTMKNKQQ